MDSLTEKIQGTSLTKTEKIIADYFLDHMSTIGLQTVTELALKIGVSDTSIIRFIRGLGFTSYSDFKREMKAKMVEHYYEALSPGEKYFKTRGSIDKNNLISDIVNRSIDNIHKTCSGLDMATIDRVSDIILGSNRKYIAAFRGTSCCASYMYRKLLFFAPGAICCDKAESAAIEQIVDIEKSDCLLLYSFPRYTELCKSLLQIAQGNGAKTIVITDRVTSPLTVGADVVIATSVEGLGFTNSYIAPMCVSEILLLSISGKVDLDSNKRHAMLEEYINQHKIY